MRRVKRSTGLGQYSILPICISMVVLGWFATTTLIYWDQNANLASENQPDHIYEKHPSEAESSEFSKPISSASSGLNSDQSDFHKDIVVDETRSLVLENVAASENTRSFDGNGWKYSFAGDLSWIRPLQSSGGLAVETYAELQERLSRWKQKLGNFMVHDRDDVRIAAWPISGSSSCDMYRTAMRMNSRMYVSTALHVIRCTSIAQSYTSTCTVPIPGVECHVQGNKSRHLILQLSSDVEYVPYFDVTIFGESFRLLAEALPVQEGSIHVCIHGVLYPEGVYGLTPDEHFELFWAHYARFGASDIHIYTNSTVYLDVPRRLKQIHGTTLWFHETPLPKVVVDAIPKELKSQFYAMNECVVRARVMGAAMVFIHDLDEFAFPSESVSKPSIKLQEIMKLELENAKVSGQQGLMVWMQSYMFNTILCGDSKTGAKPNWYHNFLDHFQAAKLDRSTYRGRRKSMLIFNDMPVNSLLHDLWYAVHDAQVGRQIQERSARYVHLHHYRESWHKNVCSQDFDPTKHAPWQRHAGCDIYLDDISTVYT